MKKYSEEILEKPLKKSLEISKEMCEEIKTRASSGIHEKNRDKLLEISPQELPQLLLPEYEKEIFDVRLEVFM